MRCRPLAVLVTSALTLACSGGSALEAAPGADARDDAADARDDAGDPDLPRDAGPSLGFCEGVVEHRYDPLAGTELEMFPDDFLTREDASSPTSLRVDINLDNSPWVADVTAILADNFPSMNQLSGFGMNAGIIMRFDGPVGAIPANASESVSSQALMLLDLGEDPPARVPYEAKLSDEGQALVVLPLRPLAPGTRHALVVTTAQPDADGGCIRPGPTLRELLTGQGDDPRLTRLHARYAELLEKTSLAPADVSAATVFTTHQDLDVMIQVAADVRSRSYEWVAPPVCEEHASHRQCEGAFEAFDYRNGRSITDAEPSGGTWTLQVSVWLPKEGVGPWPTLVFGHGLSSRRDHAGGLVARMVPRGFAVVAADALEHGEHPTGDPDKPDTMGGVAFLGLDFAAGKMDGLALRGNFNQTVADRLQLIELIRGSPDVDGDGTPDLDIERLGYHGISLGGMLGAPMLALNDDLQAGILSVPGGRLLSFVTNNPQVEPLLPILWDIAGGEAAFDRLIVAMGALVDAADPATYAAHVLRDRLTSKETPPHVLVQASRDDETIPRAASDAYARAMGAPHVGPVAWPLELLPLEPALPTAGNLLAGEITAGYFQFDRVSGGTGLELAGHNNAVFSPEGEIQIIRFLESWRDAGLPEVLDPFAELGTPPAPAPAE